MSETAHEKLEPADKCPEVEIIRESDKEQHAQAMDDSELCTFIAKALSPVKKILRDNLAYIAEARQRFAQPGRRVPVPGKPTWGKWIKQNLGISDRHVRRLLASEREPDNRTHKKAEARVEVESAGIIFANHGLEMARKLREGDVDSAKRIAAQMLEADLACPDSLLPPPAAAMHVAAPATTLAEAIIKQGMGDKFPAALEVLKVAGIAVPKVQPAASPGGEDTEHDWKAILTELMTTLEQYGDRLPIPVLNRMRSVDKVLGIQPGQMPPRDPAAPAKPFRVKRRTECNVNDFAIFRDGDKSPYEIFDTESEAQAFCAALNASPVASLAGKSHASHQSQATARPPVQSPKREGRAAQNAARRTRSVVRPASREDREDSGRKDIAIPAQEG